MSDESRKRNGEGVRRAAVERKAAATELAGKTLKRERSLVPRGEWKPVTREMEAEALEMIAAGMPMDEVCEHFGLNRSSLVVRGDRNPEFGEELKRAMALGTVSIINDTFRVARGEPGYGSGSIERDKLICDMAWRYAKTIGNRIFGDKVQVDQRAISITIAKDDTEW